MKKVTQKINEDVIDRLHKFRLEKLGRKATISQTIDYLLKEVA